MNPWREANVAFTKKFEEAWRQFPDSKSMSKQKAFASWRTHGCETIADTIIGCVELYGRQLEKDRDDWPEKKAKNMASWLDEFLWKDFEEEFERRKFIAVVRDIVKENPVYIQKYGWNSLNEVANRVPDLWNKALNYAVDNYTDTSFDAIFLRYGFVRQ